MHVFIAARVDRVFVAHGAKWPESAIIDNFVVDGPSIPGAVAEFDLPPCFRRPAKLTRTTMFFVATVRAALVVPILVILMKQIVPGFWCQIRCVSRARGG